VLSFGGLFFCFFFGEAKKKRSPRQALGSCEAKSFYGKINLVRPAIGLVERQVSTSTFYFVTEADAGDGNI